MGISILGCGRVSICFERGNIDESAARLLRLGALDLERAREHPLNDPDLSNFQGSWDS